MDPMDMTPGSQVISMDRAANMTPPLLTMPIEILVRIALHLSTTDLCSLRLTCRGVEQAIFKDFADEFFSRKQFMTSDFSLEALISIAKSRLGPRLKHIHIGLDTKNLPEYGYQHLDERQQQLCHAYYAEHQSLWSTGRINELLTEAFRSLESLETVVIRDFDSRARYRDPHSAWKSYGLTTMRCHCGISRSGRLLLSTTAGPSDFVSRVFTASLTSLAKSSARPSALKIYERSGNRLTDAAFHIPNHILGQVVPVLHGLKVLHLCIDHSRGPMAVNSYFFRKFLAHTPNLEELRINSSYNSNDEPSRELLEDLQRWLAAPPPLVPDSQVGPGIHPPPVALSRLQTLSLGFMYADVDSAMAILTKFAPTLKRLELWRFTLGPTLPSTTAPFGRKNVCHWRTFFRRLLDIPDFGLRELMVGWPRQYFPAAEPNLTLAELNLRHSPTAEVRFLRERHPKLKYETMVDFKGSDWRDSVRAIAMMFDREWEIQNCQRLILPTVVEDNPDAWMITDELKEMVELFTHRVRDENDRE